VPQSLRDGLTNLDTSHPLKLYTTRTRLNYNIMEEKITVVNKDDKIIGFENKEKCHSNNGILHRAVTIFIFDKNNQLFITKRSKFKKLWPQFWETSCSTHLHPGETYEQAGKRRLARELGFSCKLKILLKFSYKAQYKNIGSENEICPLLIGRYDDKITPNRKEIADYKWVTVNKLKNEIDRNPEEFTPWLKIAFQKYLEK
jgi:isopentenyl-diphosphate delta-isomerase